uniref:Uncharacterized protein n=1 Tax=Anopheles arabiensis TaxID=7173 RepID=A0A182HFM1_ANOAR
MSDMISETQHELKMMWTGQVAKTERYFMRINSLTIYGQQKNKYQVKDVRTVSSLKLHEQTLCYQELKIKYPHLSGLPIKDYKRIVPRMLIGLNNLSLIVPLKYDRGLETNQ